MFWLEGAPRKEIDEAFQFFYFKNDAKSAFKISNTLSEHDGVSLQLLGRFYNEGKLIEKDTTKAEDYFKRAYEKVTQYSIH